LLKFQEPPHFKNDNQEECMVPKIYVHFYCVLIDMENFKYDAENQVGLDISFSKLNFVKFVYVFVKSQLPLY
jgi:hypothetical protein